jgi:hypothetical protein
MRKRWWPYVLAAIVIVVVMGAIIAVKMRPIVQQKLISVIGDNFNSDITFTGLSVVPGPTIYASLDNVVLKMRDRPGYPPLVKARSVRVQVRLLDIFKVPVHIASVRLVGMEIHVPPRKEKQKDAAPASADTKPKKTLPQFVIDQINADGSTLEMIPRKEGKVPLEFDLEHLHIYHLGSSEAGDYYADLTNPKPEGRIVAHGNFGPWDREEPGDTPVDGKYTFSNANMASIHGLGGTLSSTGQYSGRLDTINVSGKTDVPNFELTIAHNPVHLETQFSAIVDGTTGDTYLQDVEAVLISSKLKVTGQIVGIQAAHGHAIDVNAQSEGARVQDLIRVAVPGKQTLLTGNVTLKTKIYIPPGKEDILDKLSLDGIFGISGAHFTQEKVQSKVDTLSKKGSGHPDDVDFGDVLSDLRGNFRMRNGVMHFSQLSFDVPGAAVNLDGTYAMRSGQMDFHGTLRMEAKLSQTTKGIKSALLKPFDSFFSKKGAGTQLPIKITGTRDNPQFGLDFGNKKDKSDKPSK